MLLYLLPPNMTRVHMWIMLLFFTVSPDNQCSDSLASRLARLVEHLTCKVMGSNPTLGRYLPTQVI